MVRNMLRRSRPASFASFFGSSAGLIEVRQTRIKAAIDRDGIMRSNELKLSDRGWRGQAWGTKKGRPPASVRWSAWLGGGSFLALVMLPRCWTDYLALWYRDGPLVAVGMVV